MRRAAVLVIALASLASACSGGSDEGGIGDRDAASTDAADTDAADTDAADTDAALVDAALVDALTPVDAIDAPPPIDAAPDAAPSLFDLDIVVNPGFVHVWMNGSLDASCIPRASFPQPGACSLLDDYDMCSATPCLSRVALERNGAELTTVNLNTARWWFVMNLQVPDMFAGGDVELVVEGCGGTQRFPLSRSQAAPAPVLTDLTYDGMNVRGAVGGATGATGIVASAGGAIFTPLCHESGNDEWRLTTIGFQPYSAYVSVESNVAGPVVTTPWGMARTWIATPRGTPLASIAMIRSSPPDFLAGYLPNSAVSRSVDGGGLTQVPSTTWGFRQTPSGTRLTLGGAITYVAGETTDSLTVTLPDGRFVGTFPHVTPTNDLELGFAGDGSVGVTIGPVTLTHETNPALTHQVSVVGSWSHPAVPRPEP